MDMESMLEVKIQEEESTLHISAPPSPSPPSSPSSPSSPASASPSPSPSPSSPIAQSATVDSIADVFPACVCSTGDVLASVETLVDEFQTIDLEDNQKDNGEEVSVQVSDPDYSPEYALAIMESLQEEFQNIDLSDNNKDDSEEIVVAGVSRDYDYSTEDALAIVKTLEDFQTIDVEDNENDNGDEYDDYEEFIIDRDSLIRETDTTKNLYPQRPDAPDCSYYLRTGSCRYGVNCRFNHPGRNENQARRSASPESMQVTKEKEKEDLSEKLGQQECKYYLRAGGCKFGKACRYSHSREKPVGPPPPPAHDFNFLGLPIRLGERECPYYMRTGSCKYGSNCRFHHPDPTAVGGVDIPSGSVSSHPSGASQPASSWSSPPNETVPYLDAANPYVPMMIPPQGVPPNPKWNGYQAPAYPAERSVHPPPALVMNSPTNRPDFSRHNQQHVLDEFPERPGQPECSYFMKTGDCKYRSACKFNHPKNRAPKSSAQLSPMGLPLRPDQSICTHYHRYGICKFGPACKFDHPVNYAF